MEKIYGYKESDVIGLAEFLKNRGNSSLSSTFEKYGVISGKAKGTVRNLYYALAKLSNKDKEFCDKYLSGTPLSVGKIIEFNENEERELIKKILLYKKDGRSVRSAIMELSDGDGKTALRYQNKFRNAVKNKPELIGELIKELNENGIEIKEPLHQKAEKIFIDDAEFFRLKINIEKLINKISAKTKKENEHLKNKVSILEAENLRLSRLIYGPALPSETVKFFHGSGGYLN